MKKYRVIVKYNGEVVDNYVRYTMLDDETFNHAATEWAHDFLEVEVKQEQDVENNAN